MDPAKVVTLNITVGEANVVLQALGALPFNQVYQLIGAIKQQADAQLNIPAVTPT